MAATIMVRRRKPPRLHRSSNRGLSMTGAIVALVVAVNKKARFIPGFFYVWHYPPGCQAAA